MARNGIINGVLALCCIALVAGRYYLFGHREPSVGGSFEATAHLFVGGLVGAWAVTRDGKYLWLAAIPSLFELVMFFVTR